ncbi:MAG: pyruvate kinase [Bacteroidetes bacterium]|nr:MAG: pyruvate kinase [Bacteroidota bacterium]
MPKIIFNRTKIIATVGPASNSKAVLKELILSGTDIFRLNFSHGEHEGHQQVIDTVRELNKELGTFVSLLQDLQGPKIRVDEVDNNTVLIDGQKLIVSINKTQGDSEKISTSYKYLARDVEPGNAILIDDGKIELKVDSIDGDEVTTEVIHGGPLMSRKGINLPHTKVSAPSLTEKDEHDLAFGLKNNFDWVALSFVRSAKDIINLKEKIAASGREVKVIAKIEKPEALEHINGIIEVSDAIMVARGDLGVETEMEEVPMVQKRLIYACNRSAKPVIVATQMMESMIENARPTRAETSDVANSVMDGADTVMLSAETAMGKFPVLAVQSMVRTIQSVETSQRKIYFKYTKLNPKSPLFLNDSLIQTAVHLSQDVNAKAIVGMTTSGFTAWRLSAHRPKANIFIFTGNRKLLTTLSLIWGVRGFYYDADESTDSTISDIGEILKKAGHIKQGDVFITMASMPIHERQRTNMLKINLAE